MSAVEIAVRNDVPLSFPASSVSMEAAVLIGSAILLTELSTNVGQLVDAAPARDAEVGAAAASVPARNPTLPKHLQ
jgi:hypothetical protein